MADRPGVGPPVTDTSVRRHSYLSLSGAVHVHHDHTAAGTLAEVAPPAFKPVNTSESDGTGLEASALAAAGGITSALTAEPDARIHTCASKFKEIGLSVVAAMPLRAQTEETVAVAVGGSGMAEQQPAAGANQDHAEAPLADGDAPAGVQGGWQHIAQQCWVSCRQTL